MTSYLRPRGLPTWKGGVVHLLTTDSHSWRSFLTSTVRSFTSLTMRFLIFPCLLQCSQQELPPRTLSQMTNCANPTTLSYQPWYRVRRTTPKSAKIGSGDRRNTRACCYGKPKAPITRGWPGFQRVRRCQQCIRVFSASKQWVLFPTAFSICMADTLSARTNALDEADCNFPGVRIWCCVSIYVSSLHFVHNGVHFPWSFFG